MKKEKDEKLEKRRKIGLLNSRIHYSSKAVLDHF